MLALERRNQILERLQEEKKVVVSELSQLYGVSEETIRRDLDKLEKDGFARKSYGGAVFNEDVSIELPFNIRKNHNTAGKQRIAELVVPLIHDGEKLFLDASSTAVFIAKALKCRQRLTVIINSVEILLELSGVSGWDVIATGGRMNEDYLAFLGTRTEEFIHSYHVDTAVMSCKALSLEHGIMESQEAFATVKRAMMACAGRSILAVDSTKFDQTAFTVGADLKETGILVTDQEPSAPWQAYLQELGITCLYSEQRSEEEITRSEEERSRSEEEKSDENL